MTVWIPNSAVSPDLSDLFNVRRKSMKACIIQPFYSMDYSRSDELLQWELDQLDK